MNTTKLFVDKITGEKYIQWTDGKFIELKDLDISELEELPAVAEKHTYKSFNYVENHSSLEELLEKDWKLKDILYIPCGNKNIPFRVEHVTDEKVYLVSVDTVGKSTMNDMDEYLDNFLAKIPKAFLDICGEIEHKVNGCTIRKSKVTLLSYGNTTGCENCNSADDMQFAGLKTDAERCKNNANGETCWYWEDTPYNYEDWDEDALASNFTNFLYVNANGHPYYGANASYAAGVCPCLSIKKNKIIK